MPKTAAFISGMGLDFRDFNNDGYPDIAFVALNNQTFPLFQNTGKGDFREVTAPSGMRDAEHAAWPALAPRFTTSTTMAGRTSSSPAATSRRSRLPGQNIDQPNTVFRNLGATGNGAASTTDEAGLHRRTRRTPPRLRLRRS